jgi:hypothetical protein
VKTQDQSIYDADTLAATKDFSLGHSVAKAGMIPRLIVGRVWSAFDRVIDPPVGKNLIAIASRPD